jgi:hypothetical protein
MAVKGCPGATTSASNYGGSYDHSVSTRVQREKCTDTLQMFHGCMMRDAIRAIERVFVVEFTGVIGAAQGVLREQAWLKTKFL